MKIKHLWSILCSLMITDTATNNITLVGVIEEISAEVKIKKSEANNDLVIPISFSLVSMLYKEKKYEGKSIEGDLQLTLISPEGKEFKQNPIKFIFPENNRRLRTQINIQGFPVTVNGEYIFRVEIKENDTENFINVSEFPIQITLNRNIEGTDNLQ